MTRWGIVSTARINRLVLEGARDADGADIVAVASRDAARAEAYARENGIEHAYGSYDALLAADDVDAVYISLPNSLHHEWTMRALDAGKHVLCEKPYTRRAAEAEAARDAAAREGLVVSEGFMWRHSPQTRRVVELLPELGELQTIRATFAFALTNDANVRMRPELDGGSLMDVGCYCVSAIRLLAGEPERVHAEQVVGSTGVDVRFTAVLRCADDVTAEFTSSFTFAHQQLEAIGSDGTLNVPDPWHAHRGVVELKGERVEVPVENAYKLQLENVSAAIRGEAELVLGGDELVAQAHAIERLYAAAE